MNLNFNQMTATKLVEEKEKISLFYHNTEVVRAILSHGYIIEKVILNSGGWETVTTKRRMNQFSEKFKLQFNVFQLRGEWYVEWMDENESKTVEFYDGIEISM